jgi:hypothetical protein
MGRLLTDLPKQKKRVLFSAYSPSGSNLTAKGSSKDSSISFGVILLKSKLASDQSNSMVLYLQWIRVKLIIWELNQLFTSNSLHHAWLHAMP